MSAQSREDVAKAMLFCIAAEGNYITKANMRKEVPITKEMWKKYKTYHKEAAAKDVVFHIIGQLIKVRDGYKNASAMKDKKEMRIFKRKERHYTKVVYVYLKTGMRDNEK